jgi:autotransporter-associated beta strand protein
VLSGTLQLGDASTAVTVAGNVDVSGGTLDVRQARLDGTLGVSGGTATFISGTVAGFVTVSGGSASFGAGTFAAGAAVTGGRLTIGDGGFAGGVAVAEGGTLGFANDADLTSAQLLSGSGAIVKAGTGRLTLTANNNPFTGTLTIDGGEVRIDDQGAGGDFGATSIVVNDGGTFQFGNNQIGNPDLPAGTFITANAGGRQLLLCRGIAWGEPLKLPGSKTCRCGSGISQLLEICSLNVRVDGC